MIKVDFKWYGDDVVRKAHEAIKSGARKAAESILDESNQKVPYDTGALKSSGEVVEESDGASIIYTAQHAADIHETPRNYRDGKQSKFLESSVNNHQSKVQSILSAEISAEMR